MDDKNNVIKIYMVESFQDYEVGFSPKLLKRADYYRFYDSFSDYLKRFDHLNLKFVDIMIL